MILAAVDDLLFSSKIRTTARLSEIDLTFARTPEAILAQARELKPSLIIFDLNCAKADPINTLAALSDDPELGGIRTIGFVSHVDAGTIQAARDAGCDEVMARSAFAGNLAAILASGNS